MQLPSLKSRVEGVDELSAKYAPERVNGEKESRVRPDPACAIEGEPTRRDDTVDMGMNLQFLVPGVQHAEEAKSACGKLGTGNLGADHEPLGKNLQDSLTSAGGHEAVL